MNKLAFASFEKRLNPAGLYSQLPLTLNGFHLCRFDAEHRHERQRHKNKAE
jgi:hypothetical protein